MEIELVVCLVLVLAFALAFGYNRLPYSVPKGEVWDLSGKSLGNGGCAGVASALANARGGPTRLVLKKNKIGAAGAEALGKAVSSAAASSYASIDLSENELGDAGAMRLAPWLRRQAERQRQKDAASAASSSSIACGGTHWNLSRNGVGPLGAEAISRAVFCTRSSDAKEEEGPMRERAVAGLDLGSNAIRDGGAESVAKAIADRGELALLEELDLSGNEIGPKGAKAVMAALARSGGVASLDLSSNPVSDSGLEAVSSCVKATGFECKLEGLELRSCGISDKGARRLLKALQEAFVCTVTRIDLRENKISERTLRRLDEAVKASAFATADAILERAGSITEDPRERFRLLSFARQRGSTEATVLLAEAYQNGVGTEAQPERAFALYADAAKSSDPIALSCLADCYFSGDGVEQDFGKAIELFRRAADGKEPNAIYNLGMCYLKGLGVREADRNKAFSLFQHAARLGQPLAQRLISKLQSGGVRT